MLWPRWPNRGGSIENYIKGVAFDLEGTLIDTEALHHGAWLESAKQVAGVELTLDQALSRIPNLVGGPDQEIADQIVALTARNIDPTEIIRLKAEIYSAQFWKYSFQMRPGSLAFMQRLKKKLPIAIGSAVPDAEGRHMIEATGLNKLVGWPNIVLPKDVANSKPAPDIFLETARRMNVSPDRQLVFEDSPRGARAGAAAKSMVIGMPVYQNSTVIQILFDSGAHAIFLSWEDPSLPVLTKLLCGVA